MKLATIFCRHDTDTDADRAGEHRERRQVDADRTQRDHDCHGHQAHADHLDQQHLDRRRQVGGAVDPALGKIAGDIGQPQRDDQECAELDQEQGCEPQSAQHDRNRIQCLHRGLELTDDAQRGDKPSRERHHPHDEGVADDRCHKPDDKPRHRQLGGNHEQIAAARPGRMIHDDARDDHQDGEHRGGCAGDQYADEVPHRQRPAHCERSHVDTRVNRGIRRVGHSGAGQHQAELQVEPG